MVSRGCSREAGTRRTAVLLAASIAALCVAVFPVTANAAAPIVSDESAASTADGATLEAQIDPGGLTTTYEFLVCSSDEGSCEAYEVEHGIINSGGLRLVTAELTSLPSEHGYRFWVSASNSAGTRAGSPVSFTTLEAPPPGDPNGSGGGPPYVSEQEKWVLEGA